MTPEPRSTVERIDGIRREGIPDAVRAAECREPSEPFGTPFHGSPGHGWIATVHSLKNEMRVTLFARARLDLPPPVPAHQGTRRVEIAGPDDLDEAQLRSWARQASRLQGWAKV